MTFVTKLQITVTTPTTASSTSVTTTTDLTGRVASIFLATSATFATTNDITITDDTGRKILVETNTWLKGQTRSPVSPSHLATTGAESTINESPIFLANQKLTVAVSGAGLAKTGTFTVTMA